MLEARAARTHAGNIRQPGLIDNHHRGFAILQAVFQRIRAEQHRHRHGNRPELMAGDVRDRDFGTLRHHDGDACSARHIERLQQMGKPIGLALQLGIGDDAIARDLVIDIDRDAVALTGPARAAPVGNIEILRNMPAKLAVERVVLVCGGLGRHVCPLIMVARCYRQPRPLASTRQSPILKPDVLAKHTITLRIPLPARAAHACAALGT